MTSLTTTSKTPITQEAGFSLVELVTIITIVGVISIFAMAKFDQSQTTIQYQTAIRAIAADIRLAQQFAMSEGRGTRVYFDQSYNRYYLTWDDDTYIKKLVGGGDYLIQFGAAEFNSVQITATELSDGRLDFDTSGAPSNKGTAFTGELSVVTLNSAKKLEITANTGFLVFEDL
jgi:Tfp pilus assembly protein FimT